MTFRAATCALLVSLALAPAAQAAGEPGIRVVGLFRDRAVLIIDGRQRVLTVGEPSPEGVLLISANADQAVVEIDGRRETLTLGTHIGGSYAAAGGAVVSVAPDGQGMYRVGGSINGFQVDFIVDTGATYIAMNRQQAARMGIDYRMEGRESRALTASGIATIYLVDLDRVRVGDIELSDVTAAVHDSEHPLDVLLGNSFLNRVDLQREGRLLQIRDRP